MAKSILSHNRLVGLNKNACKAGYQPAGSVDFLGVNTRRKGKEILSGFYSHHYFFQRSIARSFSKSIDSAFYLTGSVLYRHQRISGSHTQVVMAMDAKDSLPYIRNVFQDFSNQIPEFLRSKISHCIGNINHSRPLTNSRLYNLTQKTEFTSSSVHRGEFYLIDALAS